MQHIQDKEFDQLFRDKFEEAEIKPSGYLWDQIETQLVVKPRRVFPVYQIAAAVAVACLSAGLLLHNTTGVNKRQLDREAVTQISPSTTAVGHTKARGHTEFTALAASNESAKNMESVKYAESANPLEVTAVNPKSAQASVQVDNSPALEDPKKVLAAMQPLILNTHHDTKEIPVKQEKLALPESAKNEAIVLASNDVKIASSDEVIYENENRSENRGIRNMGDLINYVVDKVDKSDEKIIQFKTDDDNSSLIALNIGIIRFNSKKHK